MSIFGGRSTSTQAATPAAQSAVDPVDLVNTPAGYPTQEIYPGAVDASQYGPGQFTPPGGPAGPVAYPGPGQPFSAPPPGTIAGGGYQDASWTTGHDGPQQAWDSSAGPPFAPSGALNPALHGEDLGAVFNKSYVIPAAIGELTRNTMTGQTTVTVADTQTVKVDVSPNNRSNLDQQQWHNPDGYDPWNIPYSERAIQNNLAYEATGVNSSGTQYGISGYLPDRSPYDAGLSVAYEAPPDPVVTTVPASQTSTAFTGGWVLR